jgi:hypothetical protein
MPKIREFGALVATYRLEKVSKPSVMSFLEIYSQDKRNIMVFFCTV